MEEMGGKRKRSGLERRVDEGIEGKNELMLSTFLVRTGRRLVREQKR